MKTLLRTDFGNWGSELTDYQFACALASLGMWGGLLRSWPIMEDSVSIANDFARQVNFEEPLPCYFFIERPEKWSNYTRMPSPAVELSKAWEIFKLTFPDKKSPYDMPRFKMEFDPATRQDLQGIRWLQEQIQIAMSQGTVSFYQPLTSFIKSVHWEWPLRIGFFTDDQSRLLMDQFSSTGYNYDLSWIKRLTRIIELNESSEESVDILILNGGIKEALGSIKKAPKSIQANSICLIAGPENKVENCLELNKQILQLTQTSALCIVSPTNFGEWLKCLIRELTHGLPFDIAFAKTHYHVIMPGILWVTPEFISSVDIYKYYKHLVENPILKTRTDKETIKDTLGDGFFDLDSGILDMDSFKSHIQEIGWKSEDGGASSTIRLMDLIQKLTEENSPLESMPFQALRYLQAEFFYNNKKIERTFYSGGINDILFHIGIPESGKTVLLNHFPDEKLPDMPGAGHMLTLVFFEPNLMEQPEVAGLFLPKTGRSEPCNFKLSVPETAKKVNAWVSVLYKNRILQNAILSGPVSEYMGRVPISENIKSKIKFTPSFQVPKAFDDLDKRSRFDGAFRLNHSSGKAGMAHTKANQSLYVPLDDQTISDAIDQIELIINRSDWDLAEFEGLFTEGTTDLLRQLAWSGSSLYQTVVLPVNRNFEFETAPSENGKPKKIQVVIENIHTRMPFEFIYDFTAPGDDAVVCTEATNALANGKCEVCPHRNENPATVICPLGFWGLTRIIEWHAFSQNLAKKTKYKPFLLTLEELGNQGVIQLLKDPLVGYSDQVIAGNPESINELQLSFSKINITPKIVNSWDDWKASFDTLNPTLEILLIHTIKQNNRTLIEIGNKTMPDLNLKGLIPNETNRPVLVFLLGCGTGTSQVKFQSVAAYIQNCNPGIVVSTSSDVFGPIASKLAGYFVERLGVVKNGQSFGEVMLEVRRKALADGVPMVLCLRTYGDADWKLTH